MSNKSALVRILGSPRAYYVEFTKAVGDVCAGVFISQMFYWTEKGKDPNGWIYKTQPEIEEETGLTRKNQENARRILKARGVLEEILYGSPARMFYRVNVDALLDLVESGDFAPISIEKQIEIEPQKFIDVAKSAHMRATRSGAFSVYVDYIALLNSHRNDETGAILCSVCGKEITRGIGKNEESLSFGYIVPLNEGGTHSETNIAPRHLECQVDQPEVDQPEVQQEESTPSLFRLSNPVCLDETNKDDYPKQTSLLDLNKPSIYTKNTSKNTSKITAKITVPPPSLPKPRSNSRGKTQRSQAAHVVESTGVDLRARTAITDLIIDAYALRHAIDVGGDDRELRRMQEFADTLIKMGFETVEKVATLIENAKATMQKDIIFGNLLVQHASRCKAEADGVIKNEHSKPTTNHLDRRSQAKAASDADAEARFGHYNALLDEPFVPDPL
jgi:hypothetical protein